MNERWNLDRIYNGFDDPSFEGDLTALKEEAGKIEAFVAALSKMEPAEGLHQGIALQDQLGIGSIRFQPLLQMGRCFTKEKRMMLVFYSQFDIHNLVAVAVDGNKSLLGIQPQRF